MELLFKIIGYILIGFLLLVVVLLIIGLIVQHFKLDKKENKARNSKEKKYTFDFKGIDKIEIEVNIKHAEEDKD
ncbi:MAG: hypothetical protein II304_02760 [Bacteroidales bacterium]|nr:hypothetical protein [Bacteroidales bacterium]